MKRIRLKINTSETEILEQFERYKATEKHNPFVFWREYKNEQIGIHTNIYSKKVVFYYENGIRTWGGRLLDEKTWFFGRVHYNKKQLTLSGITLYSPLCSIILIALIIAAIIEISYGDYREFKTLVLFCIITIRGYLRTFQEQKKVYCLLSAICEK